MLGELWAGAIPVNRTSFRSKMKPAYSNERWIGRTLESFGNQTGADHEVIVADDASSGGTMAVAETSVEPLRDGIALLTPDTAFDTLLAGCYYSTLRSSNSPESAGTGWRIR